jgi:hypothetical protein
MLKRALEIASSLWINFCEKFMSKSINITSLELNIWLIKIVVFRISSMHFIEE